MRVALGTVELSDHQARAIGLCLVPNDREYQRRLPHPATREQCREWLLIHGANGLGAAEEDLRRLQGILDSRASWRRGQPEVPS